MVCFKCFSIREFVFFYPTYLAKVYFKFPPCRAWWAFAIFNGVLFPATPTSVIAISAHIAMTMNLIECFRVDIFRSTLVAFF